MPILRDSSFRETYTDGEYDLIESFLCNKTRVFYMEQYLNDSYVVPEPFTLYTIYDFDCHIMRWSNDKIRMPYKLNIAGNEASGKLYDSRTIPDGVDLFGTGPDSTNI